MYKENFPQLWADWLTGLVKMVVDMLYLNIYIMAVSVPNKKKKKVAQQSETQQGACWWSQPLVKKEERVAMCEMDQVMNHVITLL